MCVCKKKKKNPGNGRGTSSLASKVLSRLRILFSAAFSFAAILSTRERQSTHRERERQNYTYK
jgi:uncharacterized membrane protein